MSKALNEAVERSMATAGFGRLGHLGRKDGGVTSGLKLAEAIREIRLAFEASREAIRVESEELRKLYLMGRVATAAGIVLLLLACVLMLASHIKVGVVTALSGVLLEVYPVLVFSRIEKARRSLQNFLPDYRSLFAVLVLLEFGEARPDVGGVVLELLRGDVTS